MNTLPHITISWDESEEPLETFLRYHIWRREQADPENGYTKLAEITDRSLVSYQDFQAYGDTPWEYNVTVVASDSAGDETESDFATPVQVEYSFDHVFIHPIGNPTAYTELRAEALAEATKQDMVLHQRWSLRKPVAHIGIQRTRQYRVSSSGNDYDSDDAWEALIGLVEEQRAATLCLRTMRGTRLFGVIHPPTREDVRGHWSTDVVFVETEYDEAIE